MRMFQCPHVVVNRIVFDANEQCLVSRTVMVDWVEEGRENQAFELPDMREGDDLANDEMHVVVDGREKG